MIDLAVDGITIAHQCLSCEITVLAFAHLAIYTVAKATALRAIRNIADRPIPAEVALANVGSYRLSMLTRRVARWDVAGCPFVTIEADTGLWCRAHSVLAIGAHTKCTDGTLPPLLAQTIVRTNASAKDTGWLADWSVAVYSCPAVVALTALPLVLVVCLET